MEKLFELTINRYARVRTFAQGRFCRIIDFFGSLVSRKVTHWFTEKLQEGVPHDEYKVLRVEIKCLKLFVECHVAIYGFRLLGYSVHPAHL